jgi:uroporphyrinogen decarboxylase
MTSKERVIKTYNFELPDRIPLDFCADVPVYDALIRKTGVGDALELMDHFHIDFRWARPKWIGPELIDSEGRTTDYFGIPREGEAFGYAVEHPLSHVKTKADVDAYPWPKPEFWDYDVFVEECERFREYAVYGGAWGWFSCAASDLVGMDRFYLMMIDDPELAFYIMEKTTNFFYDISRIMFQKAKGQVDIFFTGDDYGGQNAPLMSLPLWRKLIKPHAERLYTLAREYGLFITQHSCGCIIDFIPDLLELGLNAIEPVQVRAKDMDFENLVSRYAGKVVLQGSIDTQKTLPFGTVQDVQNEVRSRIRLFKKRGGFVLGPTQHLLQQIPLENILTLYQTAWVEGLLN